MIIQRLSKGIKDQDWFVVGVEVLIVVVGIFIGLQVDDWNERRKEVAEEGQYIVRLLADMDSSLSMQTDLLGQNQNVIENLLFLSEAMSAQKSADADSEKLASGWDYLGWVPEITLTLTTIKEMQNTGKLGLIRDVELRQAIISMERDLELVLKSVRRADEALIGLTPIFSTKVLYVPSSKDYDPYGEGYVIKGDFVTLEKDKELVNAISYNYSWSKYVHRKYSEFHTKTQVFRDQVAAALKARETK